MLKNAALVAKIGVDTAENEPQKEPSTRLFLPSRAGGRLCLRKPVAGLCATLKCSQPARAAKAARAANQPRQRACKCSQPARAAGMHRVAAFFEKSRTKKAEYSEFLREKSRVLGFFLFFRLFSKDCRNSAKFRTKSVEI